MIDIYIWGSAAEGWEYLTYGPHGVEYRGWLGWKGIESPTLCQCYELAQDARRAVECGMPGALWNIGHCYVAWKGVENAWFEVVS